MRPGRCRYKSLPTEVVVAAAAAAAAASNAVAAVAAVAAAVAVEAGEAAVGHGGPAERSPPKSPAGNREGLLHLRCSGTVAMPLALIRLAMAHDPAVTPKLNL